MLALYIAFGLLTLLALLLAVPVDMAIEGRFGASNRLDVKLVWLFGAVRVRARKPPARPEVVPVVPGAVPLPERLRRMRLVLRLLRTRGLLRQLARLFRGIMRSVRVRDVRVDVSVGLGDPADTGMLFALIGPFTPLLQAYSRYPITLQPALTDEAAFQGYGRGTIRLQPIRLAGPCFGFIFSGPAFRAPRLMIRERWKK